MALGTVQAGYKNSLYVYPVWNRTESDFNYADMLAELTTELELACKGGEEEPELEEGAGEDSEQEDIHSERKKEWEELLEQSVMLEAMLRQMLENGLGQQKEEQENPKKRKQEEELDNEFDMTGVTVPAEGRSRSNGENTGFPGNSQFLHTSAENGAEHWNLANGGRSQSGMNRIFCLTCETECSQKKQWKITE